MGDDYNEGNGWQGEGAEYSPKSEFSKARVCEDATRKCIELRAKEMRKGYYNTTFTKEGLPLKTWIEDSRKAYCSSVISLKHLMNPEIMKDIPKKRVGQAIPEKEKGKIIFKKIDLQAVYDKYCYKFLESKNVNDKVVYLQTDKSYMPDMDDTVQVKKIFNDGKQTLVSIPGFWNSRVNGYWDEMVRSCDDLFKELMDVLDRLNYFKQQIRYG